MTRPKKRRPAAGDVRAGDAMLAAVAAARHLLGDGELSPAGATPMAYTGEHGAGGNAPLRRAIWAPLARDANADTLRTLPLQRAQSRELARTHPVAIGALGTYLDRVVGTGLAMVPAPDRGVLGWTEAQADDFKRLVQAEFALWADSSDCDITGAGNFYDRQRVVAGARAESGDCFTILPDGARTAWMPYALRLQIVEADRVGNPSGVQDGQEVAGGVRRDAGGRPQSYHFYRRHPGALVMDGGNRLAGDWVDAVGDSGRRRVLHHWQPTRPEQTRGVPWFAPIIAILKDLDTYTDAEIKAAVVSAFFTVFITTQGGAAAPVFGLPQDAAGGGISMGPAAVVGLASGEDAKFADPKRPNVAFGPFVEQILGQVGMALSIPVEVLLKRFNSSYSASRAALLDAWMFFRTQRSWLARSFCQPVYETWLAEAVASGRVPAPGFFRDARLRWAYTRAGWHGDSQGSINPKDEVAAYTAAIDAGLLTHERAEWELFGSDWTQTTEKKAAERRLLDASGLLPQPKPGAAAPATADADSAKRKEEAVARAQAAEEGRNAGTQAILASLAHTQQAVAQIAGRAPVAPVVQIAAPELRAVLELPQGGIELRADLHVPPAQVAVHVDAPHVQVDVPAPQVVIQAAPQHATVQTITRDADGEMTRIVTEPLPLAAH